MRRIVFITQQVDPGDPILAATVPKIRALAARLDEVVVLTDRAVPGALPGNCRIRYFGSRTRVGRGLRFESALARELARRPRPAMVLAHMCSIYAVLAAPLARPLHVPIVLWFNHWRRFRVAEWAERVSTWVVTVDPRTFPIDSAKVRPIGHGIDLGEFPCAESPAPAPTLRAVALGRYSRAKGLPTVLESVRVARAGGVDVTLAVHGPSPTAESQAHRAELEHLVAELELQDRVQIGGPIERSRVPDLLAGSDLLVNNMREGALDKVVYEAAASCRPVLASNEGFDALLDGLGVRLRFDSESATDLAVRLTAFATLPQDERARIGRSLRERVVEGHSVESWAEKLLALVA